MKGIDYGYVCTIIMFVMNSTEVQNPQRVNKLEPRFLSNDWKVAKNWRMCRGLITTQYTFHISSELYGCRKLLSGVRFIII